MNPQSKVYANSSSTVFYNENAQIITEIHQPKEWNPHNLNQYGKGDFLGVSTGETLNSNNGLLVEIIHSYDHQFRVLGTISKWRPRTVVLYVRQEQITTDAPPTDEEKEATKTAQKNAQNQKLIESLNLTTNSPLTTSSSSGSNGSSSVFAIFIAAVILLFILLWAFITGRKRKKENLPPVTALPKEKGKLQRIPASNSNVPLNKN